MKRQNFWQTLLVAALVLAVAAFCINHAVGQKATKRFRQTMLWGIGISASPVPSRTLEIIEGHIGPPTEDMDSEEYGPSEVRLFLERYEYYPAWLHGKIADGGVLFRSWAGCTVSDVAYWDGRYLWFSYDETPWRPYYPSPGFSNGLAALLESE